jgi:hypothetical protein
MSVKSVLRLVFVPVLGFAISAAVVLALVVLGRELDLDFRNLPAELARQSRADAESLALDARTQELVAARQARQATIQEVLAGTTTSDEGLARFLDLSRESATYRNSLGHAYPELSLDEAVTRDYRMELSLGLQAAPQRSQRSGGLQFTISFTADPAEPIP